MIAETPTSWIGNSRQDSSRKEVAIANTPRYALAFAVASQPRLKPAAESDSHNTRGLVVQTKVRVRQWERTRSSSPGVGPNDPAVSQVQLDTT